MIEECHLLCKKADTGVETNRQQLSERNLNCICINGSPDYIKYDFTIAQYKQENEEKTLKRKKI